MNRRLYYLLFGILTGICIAVALYVTRPEAVPPRPPALARPHPATPEPVPTRRAHPPRAADLTQTRRQIEKLLPKIAKPARPDLDAYQEFWKAHNELQAAINVVGEARTPEAIRILGPLLFRPEKGIPSTSPTCDNSTPPPRDIAFGNLFLMRIAGFPPPKMELGDWWEKHRDLSDAQWEQLLAEGARLEEERVKAVKERWKGVNPGPRHRPRPENPAISGSPIAAPRP